jgi:exopolysaccharide biosynthesis polyprenyl glycosylphosphotransferase
MPSQRTPSMRTTGLPDWSPSPAATERTAPRREDLPVEVFTVLLADLLVWTLIISLRPSILAVVTIAVAALAWKVKGLYSRRIALSVLDDLPALTTGVLVALAPATALELTQGPMGSRGPLVVGIALLAASVLGRSIAYLAILHQRAKGRIGHRTLMVGAGPQADALLQRIQEHPETGLRVVGSMGDHATPSQGPLPYLGTSRNLADVVTEHQISDVVIGYGGMASADLVDVLRTCDRVNVEIYVVPRLFELHTLRGSDDHIWGLPLVRVRRPAQRVFTWRVKRAFDVVLATTALLLAAPVAIAVAMAVRLELGSGIIFRQTRIGLQGRPFKLMKFRSVRPSPVTPGLWTIPEDTIGPVGRFIRHYSLDEIPQLVNVIRGDMSLVGPRPERPEYVQQFCADVPVYVHRHRVPVGMTGLAAVNGLRGDTSIEDRAQFDNWYIDNWSLWLDIKILIRTVDAVLRGTG